VDHGSNHKIRGYDLAEFLVNDRTKLLAYRIFDPGTDPCRRSRRVILADSLPRNPSGKLLKRELRERHAASGGARD
jgi:acyl-coenzyme A synthetase/AMP-(fatty) acid ligase